MRFAEETPPEFPFVALLVSGGHTQLVRVDGPSAEAWDVFSMTTQLAPLGAHSSSIYAALLVMRLAAFGPMKEAVAKQMDWTRALKPVLITQKDLRDAGIKTVEDLNAKLPSFGKSDAATAPWIPSAWPSRPYAR